MRERSIVILRRLVLSSKTWFIVGLALVVVTAALWLTLDIYTYPTLNGLIDFGCEWFGHQPRIEANTRIAYCISWSPRDRGGSAVFTEGTVTEERIRTRSLVVGYIGLDLERQEQTLVVNGHVLQPGETFEESYAFVSFNPWVVPTAVLTVKNEGIVRSAMIDGNPIVSDSLFASGLLKERWTRTSSGFVVLGIGLGFILLSFAMRRKHR